MNLDFSHISVKSSRNGLARKTVRHLAQLLMHEWPLTGAGVASCIRRLGLSSLERLAADVERVESSAMLDRLHTLSVANIIPRLISAISRTTSSLISETMYIGPARARSERYYRYQDLSVSEIDADGKNFPMFLNSLSSAQQRELSDWIESLFGYGLSVNQTEGHISIQLLSDSATTNIVDTGYGVSQILPVLGQIWWAWNRPSRSFGYQRHRPFLLLAIEQPELHLHPAHQALLADALVGGRSAKPSNRRGVHVHYVIETHSETLVNRLGELIATGKIAASDAQVLLFDIDESQQRTTNVRLTTLMREVVC